MKSKLNILAASIGLSALVAGPAQALLIDFTDLSVWAGADGVAAFGPIAVGGGLTVTLSSAGGNMTTNSSVGEAAGCSGSPGSPPLTCDGDGIGISDDEVSNVVTGEILTVTFNFAANVTELLFLDLF